MKRSAFWALSLSAVCVLVAGCGSDTDRVAGTVKYSDGTPLTRGTVNFEGDRASASGKINEDGSFAMSSLSEGDGVAPGEYRVYISGTEGDMVYDEATRKYSSPPPLVDAKFSNPATSGVTATVPGTESLDIVVEKPAPRSG